MYLGICYITLYLLALLAEEFLDNSASQLTHFGLGQLKTTLRDSELAVFFRNNHFSTILKNEVRIDVLMYLFH